MSYEEMNCQRCGRYRVFLNEDDICGDCEAEIAKELDQAAEFLAGFEEVQVCSYGTIQAGPCDRPRAPGSKYCAWHSIRENRLSLHTADL